MMDFSLVEGRTIISEAQADSGFTNSRPLEIFAERFWIWFYDNRRKVVATVWFFKVRLEDLQPLFEKIFGPMPQVR